MRSGRPNAETRAKAVGAWVRQLTRDLGPAVVFAGVVLLVFLAAGDLGRSVAALERGRAIADEDDFLRRPAVLGPEFGIFAWIRAHVAVGTAVSVPLEDGFDLETLRRITRLWLALLPDYPVASDASLIVCPPAACPPGAPTVVSGRNLRLVRRARGY